jgi:hypothetical protein
MNVRQSTFRWGRDLSPGFLGRVVDGYLAKYGIPPAYKTALILMITIEPVVD